MTGALLVVIEYFNPATFKIYGLTEKQKKKLKKKRHWSPMHPQHVCQCER